MVKVSKNELVVLKQKITQERLRSKAIVNLDITETHTNQIEHPLTKITFTFYFMDKLKLKPTKPEAQQKTHPFLPPFEPGIFITNLSDTHNLLFNKYCVVKNHVLVVTKKFEHQTNKLNRSDFAAAFKVMRSLEGFCFYNSGPQSGASQAHKHFQIMPYDKDHRYDIAKLIHKEASRLENLATSFKCSLFNFGHRIGIIPSFEINQDYHQIGETLENIYEELISTLDIDTKTMSYNLILTESWMLVVKRYKERAFDTLSVNSLGFLGNYIYILRTNIVRNLPYKRS